MCTLQELGNDLYKQLILCRNPQPPLTKNMQVYMYMETLNWRFSWFLRYFCEMGKCAIR
jgi:hypothetical protein